MCLSQLAQGAELLWQEGSMCLSPLAQAAELNGIRSVWVLYHTWVVWQQTPGHLQRAGTPRACSLLQKNVARCLGSVPVPFTSSYHSPHGLCWLEVVETVRPPSILPACICSKSPFLKAGLRNCRIAWDVEPEGLGTG